MARKQNENLKKGNKDTQFKSGREAAENGAKGGRASGVARRAKRSMYETLNVLLEMPLKDGEAVGIDDVKNLAGLKGKNVSVQEAVIMAQIKEALRGNVKAANFIKDMIDTATEKDNAAGVQIIDDY